MSGETIARYATTNWLQDYDDLSATFVAADTSASRIYFQADATPYDVLANVSIRGNRSERKNLNLEFTRASAADDSPRHAGPPATSPDT